MSIVTQRTKFAEITDKWGRFRSVAIISPDTPTVSAGEDGFLWLDTSTSTAPVLKVYDEDVDTWVVVNTSLIHFAAIEPIATWTGMFWMDTS